MAKTQTSWKSGTNPTRQVGQKSRATKVKETIGLTGWEALCDFIINEGSDKLQVEILKLDGKDYVNALGSLVEFVKPKLNRTTVDGNLQHQLSVTVLFQLDDRFSENSLNNPGISKELSRLPE